MALASTTVWEVRTTGSDSNGGGYNPSRASPGTDFSQQDSAEQAYTDLVIDAVTNTNITSATRPFTSVDVANLIEITGGTGFTTGRYEITSVSSNIATLDRAVGTTGSTGGTGNLGGALASPGECYSDAIASNTIHVKSGTYSIANGTANTSGNKMVPQIDNHRMIGYQTTRNDGGTAPNFQATASTMDIVVFGNLANDSVWENIKVSRSGAETTVRGFVVNAGSDISFYDCEADGLSGDGWIVVGIGAMFVRCSSHDNTGHGFNSVNVGHSYIGCVSYNNTGTSNGFALGGNCVCWNCVAYGNGQDGFGGSSAAMHSCINCIGDSNTRYGFAFPDNVGCILVNCIGSNQSGSGDKGFHGMASAGIHWLINCAGYNNDTDEDTTAATSWRMRDFVTLTADPYTDQASQDYTLNDTAGGGADLQEAGFPSSLRDLTGTNYLDIGPFQVQAGGGGGDTFVINAMPTVIVDTCRPVGYST